MNRNGYVLLHHDMERSVVTTRRLAVIPARGGSKRIPRKNIKPFDGRPIILRVLDEVAGCGLFDEIHVSTEDEEIEGVVSAAGYAPRFPRDPLLAGDHVPLKDVLSSVIYRFKVDGVKFDTIAMVFATAVFLDRQTLWHAVDLFEAGDKSVQVVSVAKYPAPLEWAMRMGRGGVLDPVDPTKLAMRSQDLQDAWYETADFVLYDEQGVISNNVGSLRVGFPVPHIPVDIDTEEDWKTAEMLYGRSSR